MDAKKLLKEWKRMCIMMDDGRCDTCEKCIGGKINCTCCAFEMSEEDIDTIVKTVEEWSEENPIRTYKDVLLEKFPNCKLDTDYDSGTPMACVSNIFGLEIERCGALSHNFTKREAFSCEDCWNSEYKEG